MNMNTSISLIIADDEAFIRQGLIEIVSDEQFNTELIGTAANGIDALRLIRTLKPDIAIMDIKMPGIDGLEVIRLAKEAGCNTRFLILSGYNDFSFAQKAMKYDTREYFLKPLNIAEFKESFLAQCQQILSERLKGENISFGDLNLLVETSRSYFLNQLLQNELAPADVTGSKLDFLRLNIEAASCCVVVFIPEVDFQYNIPDFDFIIKYLDPDFKDFPYECFLYKESQIICIINISMNKKKLLLQKIGVCLEKIKNRCGIKMVAGIGTIVSTLHHSFSSYQQALLALSYRIYETNLSIYDSNIICRQTPAQNVWNTDFAPLTLAILKNDMEEIKSYCDTYIHSLFFVQMPPPTYIKGMCMYLITNVQKEVTLKTGSSQTISAFNFDVLDSLPSIRHLKDWLIDFFINFSSEINASGSSHDKIIQIAKKYIREHIDQNIKAKDLAAIVNLSEAYFAIYFKNYSKINFRDYVLNEKINHAKALIASRRYSVSEVSYAVGYQDYRSFSRAFKNVVGVSPSEYLSSL